MTHAPAPLRDPLVWCGVIAMGFLAFVAVRLTIPSAPMFDEVHYLPAARATLDGLPPLNREHPPLGKQIIAAGIALFGDTAIGWRIFSGLAGAVTLFAASRAIWFAAYSRVATITFALLLASGFLLFVQTRIAMLDIFMACFCAIAAWKFAAAVREPEHGRLRLALCGIALGLAAASKWNALPLVPLAGIAFLAARVHATGWRAAWTSRGAPVPGISLAEASLWLGLVPALTYWLTFWPITGVLDFGAFLALQHEMVALHRSVLDPHPYMSMWTDWVLNIRAIWYLYEPVDGAQRGILLIGNPVTMLLGLAALGWSGWAAVKRRRLDCLAVVVIYLVSLGVWFVADKPVQFYYHYFVPSIALLAALALLLDELWQRGWRWAVVATLATSIATFAWFYPILSAAPLDGPQAFTKWMWLDSWR